MITNKEITNFKPKKEDGTVSGPLDVDKLVNNTLHISNIGAKWFEKCAVKNCGNTNIEIHHIRALQRIRCSNGYLESVVNSKGRRVKGFTALMSAMRRKQVPLCKNHHDQFDNGKYSDIDTNYLKESLSFPGNDSSRLRQIFTTGSAPKHKKHRRNK